MILRWWCSILFCEALTVKNKIVTKRHLSQAFGRILGFAFTFAGIVSGFAQQVPVEEHALSNGMKLLMVERHHSPAIAGGWVARVGSVNERPGITGIAHLFEHMMFKGSKNLGSEEHARLVGSRGGRINAYTSRDVTVYHEDITAESLPLVLALEAERFAHLDISEANLESEREVVLEERRLRVED